MKIQCFSDVFAKLEDCYKKAKDEQTLIFRGHENSSYALLPGILRNNDDAKNECNLAHKIQIEYPEEFNHREHFSSLSKMQHFGLKTRLLDFGFNPLIALYLACSPCYGKDGAEILADGELVIGQVNTSEIKHHCSDTIMVLSCLPYLTHEEQKELEKICMANPDAKLTEDFYRSQRSVHRLYHEIRFEYPTFDFEIKTNDLLKSFFVSPKKDNERLKAQNGLFAIYGLNPNLARQHVEDAVIDRIKIPQESKKPILKMLEHFGIDDSVIYPSLDRTAASFLNERFIRRPI